MSSHGFAYDTTKREDGMKILVRGERGAATVEFAIIAIVLFTIVFGIIEFGILMFDKHVLTNASREGARAGVVMRIPRLSKDDIEVIVNKYAKEHMVTFGLPADPVIDPTWVWHKKEKPPIPPIILKESSTNLSFGDELEVKVTYDFDFLFLSNLGLGPITLTAETRMRME
jgi:hypothetical protein